MPHSNDSCYEFGPFRMDGAHRVLTRSGEVISLSPKATDILLLLLRHAGELVEKDRLMEEVWPDSYVEEGNLAQHVFTLRRALGDQRSDAQYVETVPRRGYRFVAAVRLVDLNSEHHANSAIQQRPRTTLAVMPFLNATGDQALEYLADGVTENIINTLSKISRMRVMSRSAVFRYKRSEADLKVLARELRVEAILLGKITSRPSGLLISAELVDCQSGWQLWGGSLDCQLDKILDIQEEISRKISTGLLLKLTGEEEKQIATRYTENSTAYQAYLEGRFHWSHYTREEIEKAILHFRDAIESDPTYALAYAAVVDCYLRLATNYLPSDNLDSEEETRKLEVGNSESRTQIRVDDGDHAPKLRLRHEWDWRSAEREMKRAQELKSDYPAAHQWCAAYFFVRDTCRLLGLHDPVARANSFEHYSALLPFGSPTKNEEVQVFCAIAREQIDVGNYEAASLVLNRWWQFGTWPQMSGLDSRAYAELLFTTGELAGFVASAEQRTIGQKNAETLLSGSIALFEQLGSMLRAAEARIELGLCYYRQGNFDLGRNTFASVLDSLSNDDDELRCLTLIRLASLERHSGRLQDALRYLTQAETLLSTSNPWVTARHHLEQASTYKDLAVSENTEALFDLSYRHYSESLSEFEAVGNLRMVGISENNLGFLLLVQGRLDLAKFHLLRARKMFEGLKDRVRSSQVDDTLARLFIEQRSYDLAESAINRALETLQSGDEDAILAEVLSTKGIVCSKRNRFGDAEKTFEWAYGVALRCGDREGAGRAILLMIEHISHHLSREVLQDASNRLCDLLENTQQSSIRARLENALKVILGLIGTGSYPVVRVNNPPER